MVLGFALSFSNGCSSEAHGPRVRSVCPDRVNVCCDISGTGPSVHGAGLDKRPADGRCGREPAVTESHLRRLQTSLLRQDEV